VNYRGLWLLGSCKRMFRHPGLARIRESNAPDSSQAGMTRTFYYHSLKMNQITWNQFESVHLNVGTITHAEAFPEARKPAYKITVDFGPEIGTKKSSAQITDLYSLEDLVGKQVIGVTNFPPKQIGPFMSEFLCVGFHSKNGVVLAVPDSEVPNGAKLC